ncbi:MAG: MFS transporter [Candidatus Dormibacteria bacterium]
MTDIPSSHSYHAVVGLPGVRRLVVSTALGRTANQMTALVLILLSLRLYHSAVLAGASVLIQLAAVPVGPVAGALVDRLGSSIMIAIDFLIVAVVTACLAGLGWAHLLPVPVFLGLILVGTVTWPFSGAGVKALLPQLVPTTLWDRANALDSVTSIIATIAGPVLAGTLFGLVGPEASLVAITCLYVASAICVLGLRGTAPRAMPAPVLAQALSGVRYFLASPQLRGLASAMVPSNASLGILVVAVPVLVLRTLHGGPQEVGLVWAIVGVFSLLSALVMGRLGTRGRERWILCCSMAVPVPVLVLTALFPSPPMTFLLAAVLGLCLGPGDVALFSLRQRSVDPAWYGRAIAVSMTLNSSGGAIGGGLGGVLAQGSPKTAIMIAAVVSVVGAAIAWRIPRPTGLSGRPRVAEPALIGGLGR